MVFTRYPADGIRGNARQNRPSSLSQRRLTWLWVAAVFNRSVFPLVLLLLTLIGCSGWGSGEAVAPTPVDNPNTITEVNSPLLTPERTLTVEPTLVPTVAVTPTLMPTATPFLSPPTVDQAAPIPILMYHHLEQLGANASTVQQDWTVSPANFIAQLDYYQSQGYHTVTLGQVLAFFEKGAPLPIHPMVLTFDDGWIDDYTVAFPALRARGMVGTFFVPTQFADAGGKTLLGWDQIKEMDAAGMEFGGHTINHPNLTQVSADEVLRQLQTSKTKMETRLGHPTLALSYPNGAYNSEVINRARRVGYRAAVGLCCGYQIKADMLMTLPRIRISYNDTLAAVIKRLPPPENK